MPTSSNIQRHGAALRDMAIAYPGAHEAFPWGETAVKVRGKAFLFMHIGPEALSMSCKLPASHEMALMLPFAKPTGYGLGKSGWVSASFGPDDDPPLDLLREWIDESYRAIAPKKLAAAIVAAAQQPAQASGTKQVSASKRASAKTGTSETKVSASKRASAKTGTSETKVSASKRASAKTGASVKKVSASKRASAKSGARAVARRR